MSFLTQLPWVLVWIVILIFQDMNLKKGKGFMSLPVMPRFFASCAKKRTRKRRRPLEIHL